MTTAQVFLVSQACKHTLKNGSTLYKALQGKNKNFLKTIPDLTSHYLSCV